MPKYYSRYRKRRTYGRRRKTYRRYRRARRNYGRKSGIGSTLRVKYSTIVAPPPDHDHLNQPLPTSTFCVSLLEELSPGNAWQAAGGVLVHPANADTQTKARFDGIFRERRITGVSVKIMFPEGTNICSWSTAYVQSGANDQNLKTGRSLQNAEMLSLPTY